MSAGMHSEDDKTPTLRILRHPRDVATPADELAIEIAEILTRTDLDNAKRAASTLTTGGLRELRARFDSQLRAW